MNSKINSGFSQSNLSQLTIPISQYTNLKEQIKKVRYPTSAFSQAERLYEKINSFKSQKIRQQLKKHLNSLNSYRKVRGDGNCFFRALAFAYISSIQSPTYSSCFKMMNQINLTCCYPQSVPKQFKKFYDHKFLTNVLESNWQKAYNFYLKQTANIQKKALIRLFDQCPFLDFIIVLYYRALCLKAFSQFHQQYLNFIVGGQQASIRTYSQQTEGISINLCSKMLNVTIVVYQIRKQEVICYNYQASRIKKEPPTICLLFNESHYDILQFNNNIQAQKSALKRKQTFYGQVSQKMVQGSCVECGSVGYINEVSRLCLRCHQTSLTGLQNFKKEKFIRAQCSQCKFVKDNIISTFGICQSCAQMQNQAEQMRKQQAAKQKLKRCAFCNRLGNLDEQTMLCQSCLDQQKNALIKLQSTRKKINHQPQKQQQKQQPIEIDVKKAMIKIKNNQVKAQSKIINPDDQYQKYNCQSCGRMFLQGLFDGKCRTCLKK